MNRRLAAFTFVEILAAMVFLGITMPIIVSALTVSNRAAISAERGSIAAQLAENKLGDLMLQNEWNNAGGSGDFGTDYPGYRYTLTKRKWESGEMTELVLEVFYKVQGTEHSARLSTLVNEELSVE
jgi:type II secretory pathway pseudopilin PulG